VVQILLSVREPALRVLGPQEIRMTRPRKPATEIEALLREDVRQMRHCDKFGHVVIGVSAIGNQANGANWAPMTIDYGQASPQLADAALAVATDRLQRQFDAIPHD
jgi:hypothetical protein